MNYSSPEEMRQLLALTAASEVLPSSREGARGSTSSGLRFDRGYLRLFGRSDLSICRWMDLISCEEIPLSTTHCSFRKGKAAPPRCSLSSSSSASVRAKSSSCSPHVCCGLEREGGRATNCQSDFWTLLMRQEVLQSVTRNLRTSFRSVHKLNTKRLSKLSFYLKIRSFCGNPNVFEKIIKICSNIFDFW